ncbi:MAG: Leukotoxin, partial [Actinomycetota bacterium]
DDDVGSKTGNVNPGDTTDDTRPKISGTAEKGATVDVYDNGKLIGTTIADANGAWSLTPSAPLLNGPTALTAIASDPAGNPSTPSDTYAFIVDANGPVAPAITRIDDDTGTLQGPIQKGGVTDDTTPTVVGTAGPNLKINVYDGTTLLGTTTSNAQGDWSFTPAAPLVQGNHVISATAVSAAGVESDPTGPYPLVIDTTPPALALVSANDDAGASQGVITRGGITDDATPTLKGTGEPGATVTVLDNGQPIGTTTVKPDGSWALTPTTPLADGPHSITATAADAAGNTTAPTAAISFTVDTSAVVDPVITRALDDVPLQTGVVANGGATNDTRPTLEGTARAGDHVVVSYKDAAGATLVLGSATADATGHWTLTPTTPLAERAYEFTAVATGATGNPSNPSNTYGLVIDATAPNAPVITAVTDDVGVFKGTVPTGTKTDDTTPTIVGTGVAGDTIRVLDGTTVLGTTTVKADGSWSLTPTTTLADGPHEFKAIAIDAAANESVASNAYPVIVDTLAPAKPTITGVDDDVGSVRGNVAIGGTTDDVLPGIKGQAEAGATVAVFDGSTLIGTAVADANGDWSLTPTAPLLNGLRSLTAVATDAAGNPSGPSDPYTFSVDSNGPVAPAITRLDDNVGSVQGPIPKSGTTDDITPTVVGTAGPNLKINVYDGLTLLGSTTSNAQGDWSLTPTTPLATGLHNITATAVSVAGVESAPTGVFPFSIDTTAPVLTLDSANDDVGTLRGVIASGSTTDDATPTLRGTGEPGATVKVFDNGQLIGTTTVTPAGTWALTPSTPLADGLHSVTATATDPAGDTSPQTAAIPFTVDTSAVVDPVITRALDDFAPQTGVVASGGATNDKTPTLEGTARANDKVELFYKVPGGANVSIGITTADANGHWTLTPAALIERSYDFVAVATGSTGNPSQPSNTYSLLIDATAPTAPVITTVTDDVGSKQGAVAGGATTDDTTPTIVGTGTAGDTIR